MLGYINDCFEKYVVEKHGVDVWHRVREKAGIAAKTGGFLKLERYSDQSTIALATAASEELHVSVEYVIEEVGRFFVHYIGKEGFEGMMSTQGSTLFDWLCNINSVHRHLKMTFPNKMNIPEFWCEEEDDGSLSLHYHSKRGPLFAGIGSGIVKEAATVLFKLEVNLEIIQKQGRDSKFTSWRITTLDPADMSKLVSPVRAQRRSSVTGTISVVSQSSLTSGERRCPMTGLTIAISSKGVAAESNHGLNDAGCNVSSSKRRSSFSGLYSNETLPTTEVTCFEEVSSYGSDENGLSGEITAKLFPYHIRINEDFLICGYGSLLHKVIDDEDLLGRSVDDILVFTSPLTARWNLKWMRKLENQAFKVTVNRSETMETGVDVRFTASLVLVKQSPLQIMIILNPDVNKIQDLRSLNLTLSDLPIHGSLRESLFLGEHLSTQMNNTIKLEKMKQTLEHEKSLLEELLPHHAAEGLRTGKAVEPRLHSNVSLFFSDIVGFTKICSTLDPAEVIEMLNRLYSVMDFLATKFDLFKVETIGDAYFCASGLPEENENHARNIANFAIAVRHCCRLVHVPSTKEPLRLRIGIHSGSCASGVVGALNPRYCVFGDTVNTTSRFESSGEAGMIHGSIELRENLLSYEGQYSFTERDGVEMKGKGLLQTFWIERGPQHELFHDEALTKLDNEVLSVLHCRKHVHQPTGHRLPREIKQKQEDQPRKNDQSFTSPRKAKSRPNLFV